MGRHSSHQSDEPTDVTGILTVFVQRFLLFASGLACVVSMGRFAMSMFAQGGLTGVVFGLVLGGVALLGVWIMVLAFVPWEKQTDTHTGSESAQDQLSGACGYCHRIARQTDVQCASCGANLR